MSDKFSKRLKISLIVVAAAFSLPLIAGLVWWFLRGEGPAPVDLDAAIATRFENAGNSAGGPAVSAAGGDIGDSADKTATGSGEPAKADAVGTDDGEEQDDADGEEQDDDDGEEQDDADGEEQDDAVGEAGPRPAAIAGLWTLQAADGAADDIDLTGEPAVSFAGFRVDEVLAKRIGDFTAVGRTPDVSGSIELTGTALIATDITVDMTTLRSDNDHRDKHVQEALGTGEFPTAVFTLVEPVELPGQSAFSGSAAGDLTIKGITNRAEFQLDAELVDDTLVVVGSAPVIFAEYGVTAPSSPIVVSVEDHGIIEFQLFFTR